MVHTRIKDLACAWPMCNFKTKYDERLKRHIKSIYQTDKKTFNVKNCWQF